MSQVFAAVGWKVAAALDAELSPGGMGWCFVLRAGGAEQVAIARGFARAPWESSQPGVPVTPDTRFHVASMSKLVTNLAVRALVDDWAKARKLIEGALRGQVPSPLPWPPPGGHGVPAGLTSNLVARAATAGWALDLDRPVVDLIGYRLTNPNPNTATITLRHLLQHSSGIDLDAVSWPDGGDQDTIDLWADIDATFQQGVAAGHTPGGGYPGYNNKHYMILRAIVEDVMGVDYETHVRERIWRRIGTLAPSCHNDDPARTLYYGRLTTTPAGPGAPGAGANWPDYANRAGAFGWYASMRDYAHLLDAARAGAILTGTQTADFVAASPAVMSFQAGGATGIGHNGGWDVDGGTVGGCAATFDNGFAAALMVNNSAGPDATDLFSRTVAAIVPTIHARTGLYLAPAVAVGNPYGLGDLRVTTDGSAVTAASPTAANPVALATGQLVVRAAVFDGGTPATFTQAQTFTAPTLRPAAATAPTSAAGWAWRQVQGAFTKIPSFGGATPIAATGTTPTLGAAVGLAGVTTNYALEFTAWLIAPADGAYVFTLTSDDGSRLWVGDTMVCDNDGLHGAVTVTGAIGLRAGAHPIRVEYLQGSGGTTLQLTMAGPGFPARALLATDVRQPDAHQPGAVDANPAGPGIRWQLALTGVASVPYQMQDLTVVASGVTAGIGLAGVTGMTNYVLWFDGLLNVPDSGAYTFAVTSDDGSKLWIGPRLVVDNDGLHGPETVGGTVDLARGRHRIQLGFIQGGGGQQLTITMSGPRIVGAVPLDPFLSVAG